MLAQFPYKFPLKTPYDIFIVLDDFSNNKIPAYGLIFFLSVDFFRRIIDYISLKRSPPNRFAHTANILVINYNFTKL